MVVNHKIKLTDGQHCKNPIQIIGHGIQSSVMSLDNDISEHLIGLNSVLECQPGLADT